MKDSLDTCFELIKWSPKNNGMLARMKEESADTSPNVHTLCPTRWTESAKSANAHELNHITFCRNHF